MIPPSLKYRKIADRPRDPAKWDEIADVVAALSIPVIANGDVLEYDDFSRIKTATGTHDTLIEFRFMRLANIALQHFLSAMC